LQESLQEKDSGYRIQVTKYRLQDTGIRIQESGYRIQIACSGVRKQGSGDKKARQGCDVGLVWLSDSFSRNSFRACLFRHFENWE